MFYDTLQSWGKLHCTTFPLQKAACNMSVTLQDALAVAVVPHTLLAEGVSCFVFLFVQISKSWILAELTWTLYGSPASQPGWTPVLCQTSVLATARGTWGRTLGSPPAAATGILCRQFPKITNTIIFRAKLVNSTWSKGKDPNTQRPQSWPWVRPCSHRGQ